MKRFKWIEFIRSDVKICERFKRFLKENGIYYEFSSMNYDVGYHLEVLCDSNDERIIEDFLDQLWADRAKLRECDEQ